MSAAGAPPRRPAWPRSRRSSRRRDDDDLLRDALLENLHRSQLNAARGGRRLPAAAGRLRLHPRRAGHADRPLAAADLQHPAPAQAAAAGAAPGRGGRAQRRPRPRPARPGRRRRHGAAGPADRGRGPVGAQRRGDRRRSASNDAPRPAAPSARRRPSPPARRPRRRALRPLRHPRQHRPGPAQGQAHGRVRLGRGPEPHRRAARVSRRTRPSATDRRRSGPARRRLSRRAASGRPSRRVVHRDRRRRGTEQAAVARVASQRAGLGAPAPSRACSTSRA